MRGETRIIPGPQSDREKQGAAFECKKNEENEEMSENRK